MDCHESLMQRRRKKKASAAASKRPPGPAGPGVKLDKSLPSLPPKFDEPRPLDETPSEAYGEVTADNTPRTDHGDAARPGSSASRPTTAQGNFMIPNLMLNLKCGENDG